MTTNPIFLEHALWYETKKSVELFKEELKNPRHIPTGPKHAWKVISCLLATPFELIAQVFHSTLFTLLETCLIPTQKQSKLRLLGFRLCQITFLEPLTILTVIARCVMRIFGSFIGIVAPQAGCTIWKWGEQLLEKNQRLRTRIWDALLKDAKTQPLLTFYSFQPEGTITYFGQKRALKIAHIGRTDQDKENKEKAIANQLIDILTRIEAAQDPNAPIKSLIKKVKKRLKKRSDEIEAHNKQQKQAKQNIYLEAHKLCVQASLKDALGQKVPSKVLLTLSNEILETLRGDFFSKSEHCEQFFTTYNLQFTKLRELFSDQNFGGIAYTKLD